MAGVHDVHLDKKNLEIREAAEVDRSAIEAQHIEHLDLRIPDRELKRYLFPPTETAFPLEYCYHLLGDVTGKTILDYGCGDGLNTATLAKLPAIVHALDISPDLIRVAHKRMQANGVEGRATFHVASGHSIPLPDESIDIVFGIAILHHLDLEQSAREVWRVLKPGGRAIFQEPVRNSRLLAAVRRLIPYRHPDVSEFERPLTDEELRTYGRSFASCRLKAFTLPTTQLANVLAPRWSHPAHRFDGKLLRYFPPLAHFSAVRVMELVKQSNT